MYVVIVTDRRGALHDFAQGLGKDIEWTDSAAGVLARAKNPPWQLVVLDTMMPGLDYKVFLMDLLKVNAMLDTVVITDMNAEAFHHDSEGLGVLCAVPVSPVRADGVRAMNLLCTILGLERADEDAPKNL